MANTFEPKALPLLIGSLPLADHQQACDMVMEFTPEIPLWVQLPVYEEEGMIQQFMPGLPGLDTQSHRPFIDSDGDDFPQELSDFYEEHLDLSEGKKDLEQTRFVMKPDTARGFFVFMEKVAAMKKKPVALKGQITGPITFGTSVKDGNGRAIFYDAQLRDVQVKLLAEKARWQTRRLKTEGRPVIVFLDEPALAGFGSSEFISISREEVSECLEEVMAAVHAEGGLAGIHVCANADWSLLLESSVDIVNFDAYGYFDRFMLYDKALKAFLDRGGIVAWGIVPTLDPEQIETESTESLLALFEERMALVTERLGVDLNKILTRSLITPACGTGSISLKHARKVLRMTREIASHVRIKHGLA